MTRARAWAQRLLFIMPVALVFAGPSAVWWLLPGKTLGLVIVDKTVPFRNYREHGSLAWLLRALKIRTPGGRFIDPARDYLGFDPGTQRGRDVSDAHLENQDVLFLADTYGVYQGDYEGAVDVAALEHSPKLYGGMSEHEAGVVERFAAGGGMVIGEFNTFASPTGERARARLEAVFGVRWTKWVARYWPNLQDKNEVPTWLGRLYEAVYHRPFDITGGGLVFVREDADIVVLQMDRAVEGDVIQQLPTPAGEAFDVPKTGRFRFWLDVLEPAGCTVLAEHRVLVTRSGGEQLAEHGLPQRFPALVRRGDAFYFAGDFVDTDSDLGNPERAGLLAWRRRTADLGGPSMDASGYFFNWYVPIVSRLLVSRAH